MNTPTHKGRTLALLAALLGWMFDGMEMGLFPLVGNDALAGLLKTTDKSVIDNWYGIIIAGFLVGAATGGVLFGWLGDKIGRVRAMTISVLLYSLSSGLCAFSQEAWHLAVLRFVGALGMGGEWALGVALVMEIWPNKSRAFLAAMIGAFGNLGYTLCGCIQYSLVQMQSKQKANPDSVGPLAQFLGSLGFSTDSVDWLTANNNWRLLMLIGAIPALLTFVIRIFVPESEKWKEGQAAGKASHWSERDLIGILIGAVAGIGMISLSAFALPAPVRILGTVVGFIIVLLGYLYPIHGYLSRANLPTAERKQVLSRMLLAAGLSGVALLGTWAGLMWMYRWVGSMEGRVPESKAVMQIVSSIGAALGCVAAAMLGGHFGRKIVYACLCILSAVAIVAFYRLNSDYTTAFVLSTGVLGFITASFYGWLPLYLPELFPTAVRATGQGFGFNCGRVIAAVGTLQMTPFLAYFENNYGQACLYIAGVYGLGLVLIAFAPETHGKELPE